MFNLLRNVLFYEKSFVWVLKTQQIDKATTHDSCAVSAVNCIFFVFIRTALVKPSPFTNGPDPTPASGTIVPPTPRPQRYKICSPHFMPYYCCHCPIYKTSSKNLRSQIQSSRQTTPFCLFLRYSPEAILCPLRFGLGYSQYELGFSVRNVTLGLWFSSENIGLGFCVMDLNHAFWFFFLWNY